MRVSVVMNTPNTNQEPRKTISYCLENNGLYYFLNPRWCLENRTNQEPIKNSAYPGTSWHKTIGIFCFCVRLRDRVGPALLLQSCF